MPTWFEFGCSACMLIFLVQVPHEEEKPNSADDSPTATTTMAAAPAMARNAGRWAAVNSAMVGIFLVARRRSMIHHTGGTTRNSAAKAGKARINPPYAS